jgi:hypothetical protein
VRVVGLSKETLRNYGTLCRHRELSFPGVEVLQRAGRGADENKSEE